MVDQREALAVTTDLLTQFIWFALPGFEPSNPPPSTPPLKIIKILKRDVYVYISKQIVQVGKGYIWIEICLFLDISLQLYPLGSDLREWANQIVLHLLNLWMFSALCLYIVCIVYIVCPSLILHSTDRQPFVEMKTIFQNILAWAWVAY